MTVEKMAVLMQIRITLLTDRACESESDVDHLYFVADAEKSLIELWESESESEYETEIYLVGGVEKSLIEQEQEKVKVTIITWLGV